MAPRSAKAKKAADVKTADADAPKKGRGKKNIEEVESEIPEIEVSEKVIEKKKRGKRTDTNGQEEKEVVVAPKKGRKKIEDVKEEEKEENGDEPVEEEEEGSETNGHTEESQSSGRGRKKLAKDKPAETKRGRKPKEEKQTEEKPKTGRGRKAQPKVETEEEKEDEKEDSDFQEDVKPEPKGRKKGRVVKEKTPESDKDEGEEEEPQEGKKRGKGKKGQAKEEELEDVKEEAPAKKRKVTKKEDKEKAEPKEDAEEPEAKSKNRRGQKKEAEVEAEAEEPTTKRRRKPDAADKKKAPLKNKSATDYESIDFASTAKTSQGKEWNFKISSWNVDGIRAWVTKGGLEYIKYEKPDILCLQEVKCSKEKLPEEVNIPGYHTYWLCSEKDGYAGVGIYTAKLAMNVHYGLQNKDFDNEGRVITAEYEQFFLVCVYVPNAGRKLVTLPKRLEWNEEFRKHVKELDKKKPVIICGDMNVSHQEIDLANPKTNRRNAGFTAEERQGMTELLGEGFVDTFRLLYPDKTGAYTFWTYMAQARAKNVGWRLDYFLVSERLVASVCDIVIRSEVFGSDHCPVTLLLHLTSADKPKE